MLFTTKTCPKCKMAKTMLNAAGIDFVEIDAIDNKELTLSYGVRDGGTLLVPNGNGFDRYDNPSAIKGYIESLK
jgi:ribonucleoside-triphosphate reductase